MQLSRFVPPAPKQSAMGTARQAPAKVSFPVYSPGAVALPTRGRAAPAPRASRSKRRHVSQRRSGGPRHRPAVPARPDAGRPPGSAITPLPQAEGPSRPGTMPPSAKPETLPTPCGDPGAPRRSPSGGRRAEAAGPVRAGKRARGCREGEAAREGDSGTHPPGGGSAAAPGTERCGLPLLVAGKVGLREGGRVASGEVLQVELHVHVLALLAAREAHIVSDQLALQLLLGQHRRIRQELRHRRRPQPPPLSRERHQQSAGRRGRGSGRRRTRLLRARDQLHSGRARAASASSQPAINRALIGGEGNEAASRLAGGRKRGGARGSRGVGALREGQ